ncbi:hypothetical protein BTA51_27430 [Hahella sp. CCB-MM4]|uniref:sensor histidine kinase n=1 Tax=Hahella sp. (strain CCB-MM4) TaxID=1926491 RepID=UPI000B9B87D3|nr:ATP-binding protein [Hahella sp. CCB-MM4]OZG70202.1 hypothetical protein BTA51_27430 [Hahella sp. CCB-MM4]
MKSIRQQVVLTTFSVMLAFLLILCLTSYFLAREYLINQFDQELLADFQSVVGMTKIWPDGEVWVDLDSEVLTAYAEDGNKLFEVWTGDGTESLDRSVLLEQQDIHIHRPIRPADNQPAIFDTALPDCRNIRAATQVLYPQWGWDSITPELQVTEEIKETKVEVLVARNRAPLDHDLAMLLIWFIGVMLFLPVLLFAVVWYGVGKGLTPLKRLTHQVSGIQSTNKLERLDAQWPVELRPPAEKINELLDRLEEHFLRERRFTSSAAHELRTPISELQLATEVALLAKDQPQRLLTAVQQAHTLAGKMAELVSSLSLLSRQQKDEYTLRKTTVDLVRTIQEVVAQHDSAMRQRGLTISAEFPDSQFLYSDQTLCQTIVRNLINNAVSYAPENTDISVALKVSGEKKDHLLLQVSNICPQIQEQDLRHMFEPFWRKETVYSHQHHFGLGLAITREACDLLGFQLNVSKPAADVIEFSVAVKLTD